MPSVPRAIRRATYFGADRSGAVPCDFADQPANLALRAKQSAKEARMTDFAAPLPIDDVLGAFRAALAVHAARRARRAARRGQNHARPARPDARTLGRAQAPAAARASASRSARSGAPHGHTLGEKVGETIGLRVRLQSLVSARTRIEVVTEGVFTRMILDDPSLEGVAAVLFDEFHERSLDADLGLALALDAQAALREDLRLLVMSATLDGARVRSAARRCAADRKRRPRLSGRDPLCRSEPGPAHRRRGRARHAGGACERDRLDARVPAGAGRDPPRRGDVRGAHQPAGRRHCAALWRDGRARAGSRRRAGEARTAQDRARHLDRRDVAHHRGRTRGDRQRPHARAPLRARHRPHAARDGARLPRQRRPAPRPRRTHRAGRLLPPLGGGGERRPQALCAPEILSADLSGLLLDCAAWGETDPARLALLDAPPRGALAEARALLIAIGAIDWRAASPTKAARSRAWRCRRASRAWSSTPRGRRGAAAEVAVVLTERGLGGDAVDLTSRLEAFRRDRSPRAEDARQLARRLAQRAAQALRPALRRERAPPFSRKRREAPDEGKPHTPPRRPSRLRLSRPRRHGAGKRGEFLMANGRAASLEPHDALAGETFLAVGEVAGRAAAARILLAAPLSLDDIERVAGGSIETAEELIFDLASASLRARRRRRLGALVLADQTLPVPPNEPSARALARGVLSLGVHRLPWTKALRQWRDRVMFLRRAEGEPWPDLSDERLGQDPEWLAPFLIGKTRLDEIGAHDLSQALSALLAVGSLAPSRRGGADTFPGADRHGGADRLRGRGRACDRAASAGAVRPRRASVGRCASR